MIRYLRQTLRALREQRPHALVVIDSPGYSMRVAKYARRANPAFKIIDYVSPSVWAWRPSRANSMRHYIDHVLALLPFEPEVHRRLGGPPCSYVGHPIVEQIAQFRPSADEARRREAAPPVIVVLPGSRSGEIAQMAATFGETIGRVRDRIGPIEVVVPTAPHHLDRIAAATASWPVRPRIVTEQADKQAAFRIARAALAKSGTVTLELALAGVPMVVAYKVSAIDAMVFRRFVTVPSVVLANLVLGENVVPELLQENCTPEQLTEALVAVLGDTAERRAPGRGVRAGSTASCRSAPRRPHRARPTSCWTQIRAGNETGRLRRPVRKQYPATTSAARSARSRAAARPCRAGADGRCAGPDPRSSLSTARSSRPRARARTAR